MGLSVPQRERTPKSINCRWVCYGGLEKEDVCVGASILTLPQQSLRSGSARYYITPWTLNS